MNLKDCFEQGLLRRDPLPKDVLKKEMTISTRFLQSAEICLEQKIYDMSIISCYSAVFHAARAVLFKDGIRERSHVCLIIYIREKYDELAVHARTMDIYRRSRHNACYSIDIEFTRDDALLGIDAAKDMIEAIKDIVDDEICGTEQNLGEA